MKKKQKHKKYFVAAFLFVAFACFSLFASTAGATEMLQNTSFEDYDTDTMLPDHWEVIYGNMEIYTEQAYDGSVSFYCLGGTYVDGVDTPNEPQSSTLVQLIDLSTLADWDASNWFTGTLTMAHRKMGAKIILVYLEYLPASYNTTTVTADDTAWNGADVQQAMSYFGPVSHARPDRPWYTSYRSGIQIPRVRWARLRLEFDVEYQSNSYFEDGPYYIAVDAVSLDLEAEVPEDPCTDNLLTNPGFESVADGVPTDWQVLSGRMTAISFGSKAPYAGDRYAGNIGGYAAPNTDPEGDPIDNPDPPQYGTLVQLIDLSTLSGWSDGSFMLFNFSGYYLNNGINALSAKVEYLPETYNDTTVSWNDAAWDSEAQTAVTLTLSTNTGLWTKFETDQGAMPKVRWVRVHLNVDDSSVLSSSTLGEYLGGFDQVCFQAEAATTDDLIENPSFEESTDTVHPDGWYEDPDNGALQLLIEPFEAKDGSLFLAKSASEGDTTGCVYQVIDLADNIFGWTAIDQYDGEAIEYRFVQFTLSAWIANIGGSRVSVGLEYLPYSYNTVDGIAWDDAAWETRQWSSDGTSFSNAGGDAIDAGYLIEDTTVSTDPIWRQVTYSGWLPRVRWLRLRIELDAADTGGDMPLVGIDAIELTATCKQYGPYSGFGYLPEAIMPESDDAPDKPVPGWVGPEGDGICGGYTGQTDQNYVNPAFAGFADDYANYINSGQYVYQGFDGCPECITGRPFTDSGWDHQIVSLGDLELSMLADWFGPSPTGDYNPGEITAVFNESPIVNGEGFDFATFENGFVYGWTTDLIFAELTYVEVSSNGTDFIRMPTHSLTPYWPGRYGCIIASGVFGITGKHVNAYGDSWGTPFDLEWIADHPLVLDGTVDLNDIRYVRQVDIPGGGPEDAQGSYTALFYDDYNNPIFDSWVTWGSGGADLDAVGVLNTSAADSDGDYRVDYWDNCPQTANEKQYDTDDDGYGNACDCDINGDEGGDGAVNMADYAVFRAAYGSHGPQLVAGEPGEDNEYTDASESWNADADFNGDLQVDMEDYAIFRSRWLQTAPFE